MNPLTTRVTLRAHGDASPDLVWERYVDLDLWSTWSPQIMGVEASPRRLSPGLQGRVVGPLGLRVPFTVLEVGDRDWSWQVQLPLGLRLHLEHRVYPRLAGAATELVVQGPTPLVLGYAPLAQLALRKLVQP